ncbi:MAG: VWA domain-containing protein [Terriglobales bacterium]
MRRIAACIILLSAACLAQKTKPPQIRVGAWAWKPTPLVIQTQSNLVPLEVVVRRSDGSVVAKLPKGNFLLTDDGQPVTITQFSEIDRKVTLPGAKQSTIAPTASSAAAPETHRTIALWFDDVNTENRDLEQARNAALRFLQHARNPNDRIGVFSASGSTTVPYTQDTAALLKAVGAIRAHPRASEYGMGSSCPHITPFEAYQIAVLRLPGAMQAAEAEKLACQNPNGAAGGTPPIATLPFGTGGELVANADATWNLARIVSQSTLDDVTGVLASLATQPGKRILLMASAGFLTETLGSQEEALVKSALHANITVNALDARGLYTVSPDLPLSEGGGILPLITFAYDFSSQLNAKQAADEAMVNLAQSTGGLFYQNNNDLTLGFDRLGLEPPVIYELAFAPSSMPNDGKFHKLEVKLNPPVKHSVIQARRGYFDPPPLSAADQLKAAEDRAMHVTTTENGVASSIAPTTVSGVVAIDVHVDVSRVPFVKSKGRRRQLLMATAGLFTAGGQFVTGEQGVIALALDGSHYKHFRQKGLGSTLKLMAAAGRYRLRVVVGEASDGKLTTYNRTVTIP